MTTPPVTNPTIDFKRNLSFRSGAAGIEITGTKDPAVLQAIAADTAFPGTDDIGLGQISANAQAGKDVTFGTPSGNVSFNAGATANMGLGMYVHADKLLADVSLDQHVGQNFTLPQDANSYFMLFDWGYDVTASGKGGVALGTASVKFSADAELAQNYAVIRRFDKTATGARTAITNTVDSFVLPTFVHSDGDIEGFTWIYTLTDADLKGSIGATYGYDFNWVHEVTGAGLSGDIGLKIHAGITASVGFTLSGRFAILVSRDNASQVVRVRVFKRPTHGLNFALNAGASVTPSTGTLLPEKMDDLIASILGVYAPQLLKDLSALGDWASGNATLPGALAKVSSGYMLELIGTVFTQVTGKAFNPDQEFVAARDMVVNFLKTWGGLDAKVASAIWKLVPGKDAEGNLDPAAVKVLQDVTGVVNAISTGDNTQFATFLNGLGLANVITGPAGQIVQALAPAGIFSALTNAGAFGELQKGAQALLPFLKAGQSQQTLLQALHDFIDPRVKLTKITDAIAAKTADVQDGWLQAKIAAFLEKDVFDLPDLMKVETLIDTLHTKAQSYYAKGLKALNTTYGASLAATYESTTTTTALLDAEFDFGNAAADKATLQSLLDEAVHGDLTNLLMKDTTGVKLNAGSLSHGIDRHTHIELRLPFYSSTVDEINSSLAVANSVEAEGHRMMVYQLNSSDEVKRITNRGGNDSHLAVGATIPPNQGNATRVFGTPTFTYSYSYRLASRNIGRERLQFQMEPYVTKFVPNGFVKTPFETWLGEMDKAVPDAPDTFGFALSSVDLSVPSDVVAAWLRAPAKDKDPAYMAMSIQLQKVLRDLIPFYYFADPDKFGGDEAKALLAYAAIPLANSVRDDGSFTTDDVFWNWPDDNLRDFMVRQGHDKLRDVILPPIFARLQKVRPKLANSYSPAESNIKEIFRVSTKPNPLASDVRSLVLTEAGIISGAVKAGVQLAKFLASGNTDVKQATRALASFGSAITQTFNKNVSGLYGGDALRPLGTLLFIAAAEAIGGRTVTPDAMFRFLVMDPKSQFDPTVFLTGTEPDSGVLAQQAVTNIH